MARGAQRALIAGAVAALPKEEEYLEQYPTEYRQSMQHTIREILDMLESRCTFVEYRAKGKVWVRVTPVSVLTRMGKRFTQFEARISPGGMYSVVKRRLGA